MKSSKGIYIFLFSLTIINVVLGFLNMKGCFTSTTVASSSYNDILIAIAGFLAAFLVISIYLIFYAHVDRENERIDKIMKKAGTQGEKIDEIKIEADENLKKTEELNNEDENFELNLYRMKVLMDLTSGYSPINKRREAIQYFSQNPPETKDAKMFILNFFSALNENQRNERYYQELEKLLSDWGMISPEDEPGEVQPV